MVYGSGGPLEWGLGTWGAGLVLAPVFVLSRDSNGWKGLSSPVGSSSCTVCLLLCSLLLLVVILSLGRVQLLQSGEARRHHS